MSQGVFQGFVFMLLGPSRSVENSSSTQGFPGIFPCPSWRLWGFNLEPPACKQLLCHQSHSSSTEWHIQLDLHRTMSLHLVSPFSLWERSALRLSCLRCQVPWACSLCTGHRLCHPKRSWDHTRHGNKTEIGTSNAQPSYLLYWISWPHKGHIIVVFECFHDAAESQCSLYAKKTGIRSSL